MTATTRSNARYARAAYVIPKITLNDSLAADLAEVIHHSGACVTICIRDLIAEAAKRIRSGDQGACKK